MINFEKIILEYSEQYTDFAASTIAFMESQEKKIDADEISRSVSQEKRPFFNERLGHYRDIYRPQQ
ncbi:DNA polymerase III subunit theta [Pectobacterium brasiliense]|uniref:Surface composition regulator n=1 Tax=Pectobacterium brasiliense TaxID=180957 RepID=A0AAE2WF66_9GAMM|nr:DNA polymerase III subunit theta [Pectobacterium brasiliense]MBN3072595.1 DNA polymerase III subunit theta [Pectobacterium brasiliense]MBN3168357.1 DNA polymerase III subunit theta [Pectobacterium brasiliense]